METVTFALTPHTSAIIVQRRRYVDAILRSMETKKQLRSRVLARRDALPEEETAAKVRELETAIGKKVYPISAIAKKGVFDCLLDVNHYIKRERRQESEEDEQAAMPEKSSWSPL